MTHTTTRMEERKQLELPLRLTTKFVDKWCSNSSRALNPEKVISNANNFYLA